MRFALRKDIKRRREAFKAEKRNRFFQAVLRVHEDFSSATLYQKMFLSFKKSFITRVKNRCLYSFSKHSIIRFYHVNRHSFRTFASFGTFFGLVKSSW